MKSPRFSSVARRLFALLTCFGWLVLSNHCALGQISKAAMAGSGHDCCRSGATVPVDHSAGAMPGVECCKALHAVLDVAKPGNLAPVDCLIAVIAEFRTVDLLGEESCLSPADTGPPAARSFSELVLHRSLRSHAPPVLV